MALHDAGKTRPAAVGRKLEVADRRIVAAGQQVAAIVGEGDGVHVAVVLVEHKALLQPDEVPEPHGAVPAGRGGKAPVRRHGNDGHLARVAGEDVLQASARSEEHTSELQSLMRHSYAV